MAKNKMSKPAGKNDNIEIKGVALEQIFENNKNKTLDTNSTSMRGILSTELREGMTIKVENGGKPSREEVR